MVSGFGRIMEKWVLKGKLRSEPNFDMFSNPSLIITSRVFCVNDVVTLSSLLLYIDDDPILN